MKKTITTMLMIAISLVMAGCIDINTHSGGASVDISTQSSLMDVRYPITAEFYVQTEDGDSGVLGVSLYADRSVYVTFDGRDIFSDSAPDYGEPDEYRGSVGWRCTSRTSRSSSYSIDIVEKPYGTQCYATVVIYNTGSATLIDFEDETHKGTWG